MQALPLGRAPVPSPAVLRFLRIQAECLPFLATHSQVRRHHQSASETTRPYNWKCLQNRQSFSPSVWQGPRSGCRGVSNSANKLARWTRPWQQARQKKTAPLQPNDLPPLPGFLDDSSAATTLGRIVKPTNELKMRCTEFDGNGKITLVNGTLKKSELIAKVHTFQRNLYQHPSDCLP